MKRIGRIYRKNTYSERRHLEAKSVCSLEAGLKENYSRGLNKMMLSPTYPVHLSHLPGFTEKRSITGRLR